jgi:hypothetical protein
VSLILDALRKLEREKDAAPEPGVLVVGSVAWGARTRSRRPLLLSLAAVALVALVAFTLRRSSPPPAAGRPEMPVAPAEATPRPSAATADGPGPPDSPAPTPPPARRSTVPSTPAAARDRPKAPVPAVDDTSGSATRPESPSREPLRLNAISERDGRAVALINDRLLFEGDSFDGVRILRIGEAEVEVEVGGKRRVLRF